MLHVLNAPAAQISANQRAQTSKNAKSSACGMLVIEIQSCAPPHPVSAGVACLHHVEKDLTWNCSCDGVPVPKQVQLRDSRLWHGCSHANTSYVDHGSEMWCSVQLLPEIFGCVMRAELVMPAHCLCSVALAHLQHMPSCSE